MKILDILKSKIFINLLAAVIVIFLSIIATSTYLKIYTRHDKKIFTPSFSGMSLSEAEKLAKQKGVNIKVIDSVYESFAKPGTIVAQTPNANFKIKKGRTIFVTIKSFNQKMVKMPALTDISLMQARAKLESNGLLVGHISYTKSDYNDLVLDYKYKGQTIKPNTKIPAGSKIDLIVGQKDAQNTIVPSFKGLTYVDASFKAAEYGLNIGQTFFDNSVITKQDSASAVVYKQSVSQGITVPPGTEIDMWFTLNLSDKSQ